MAPRPIQGPRWGSGQPLPVGKGHFCSRGAPDCPKGSAPQDLRLTSREEVAEEAAGALEGDWLVGLDSPAARLRRDSGFPGIPALLHSGRSEGDQVSIPNFKRAKRKSSKDSRDRNPEGQNISGGLGNSEKWEN